MDPGAGVIAQESTQISSPDKRAATNPKSKLAKERLAKVPRPPNAFILYRQDQHPKIKSEQPDIHNNQICKFSPGRLFVKISHIPSSGYCR